MNDRERNRLERENAELKAEIDVPPNLPAPALDVSHVSIRNAGAPRPPLREWVLDTLAEVRNPLYSQYLTALHFCRFNRSLAPARLGTLSADERKRVSSGRSPKSC